MNREDSLRRTIASILAGTHLPSEIVVGNDGETFSELPSKHPLVRYFEAPKNGLSANRNHCLSQVRSEYVAFVDDDAIVTSDFVAIALKHCNQSEIVTGWENNHSTEPAKKVTSRNASFLGFQKLPVGQKQASIVMNATVFPKSLFSSARFDEFSRYGGEELDMARHAVALGYSIKQVDDLWVEHFPSSINRDQYQARIFESRLYLTAKAYYSYDHRVLKALAFLPIATLHQMLSDLRKGRNPFVSLIKSLKVTLRLLHDLRRGQIRKTRA